MKSYTTISGDTWDKVAYQELGSETLTLELMEANIDYITTVIFPAGITLIIPDVTIQTLDELPPWKRGDL